MLNIYYIYQDENTDYGTYHAAIVVAGNEEQAKETKTNWKTKSNRFIVLIAGASNLRQ